MQIQTQETYVIGNSLIIKNGIEDKIYNKICRDLQDIFNYAKKCSILYETNNFCASILSKDLDYSINVLCENGKIGLFAAHMKDAAVSNIIDSRLIHNDDIHLGDIFKNRIKNSAELSSRNIHLELPIPQICINTYKELNKINVANLYNELLEKRQLINEELYLNEDLYIIKE